MGWEGRVKLGKRTDKALTPPKWQPRSAHVTICGYHFPFTAGTEDLPQRVMRALAGLQQFVNARFKLYNEAFHSQPVHERVNWWAKDIRSSHRKNHTPPTHAPSSRRPTVLSVCLSVCLCLSSYVFVYFTRWQRTTQWDEGTHVYEHMYTSARCHSGKSSTFSTSLSAHLQVDRH